jgi:hypothetical protein
MLKYGRVQMEVVEAYLKLQSQYFLKGTAENHEISHDSLPDEISTKDLQNMKQECYPLQI